VASINQWYPSAPALAALGPAALIGPSNNRRYTCALRQHWKVEEFVHWARL
jgi:hypothetical protein